MTWISFSAMSCKITGISLRNSYHEHNSMCFVSAFVHLTLKTGVMAFEYSVLASQE